MLTGESRRQAALQVGLATLPVIVLDRPLNPGEQLLERYLENDMRADFTSADRARIYSELMKANHWTQAELAEAIHTSPAEVSKTLAISKRLPEDLQAKAAEGLLCPTVAYQLSKLNDVVQMRELADKAMNGLLKRDAVAIEVAKRLGKNGKKSRPTKLKTPGGLLVVVPALDLDVALAETLLFVEAIKKAQKHGLPLAALSSLLKGA